MIYPPADRHNGDDPYRWLEDARDPATDAWSDAQDELWDTYAETLPGREAALARVGELSSAGMVGAPVWRGNHSFHVRRGARENLPVLHRDNAPLLDPNLLDPTGATVLDDWQPDLEGRLMAVQLSRGGNERSVMYVVDTGSGGLVEGPIEGCRYSPVVWLPGGDAFYYVRSRAVWLHRVGTPVAGDLSIMAGDASYGLASSADGRWLVVSAAYGTHNDVWLADLDETGPERPRLRAVLESGTPARTAPCVGRDGRLYVVTDLAAPRGRLCVADPATPGDWHELVPEDPESVLAGYAVLDGPALERPLLLVSRLRDAVAELALHDLATGVRLREVDLPGLGSIGHLGTRPEGGHEAWFTYTDHVTPSTVLRFDASDGSLTVWEEPPGVVKPPEITTTRMEYTSADGTSVPMVVLSREGDTGPRPTILYGYGGFGTSLAPAYSTYILPWLAAGGVFALAGVRGGGERGESWHQAGRRELKQNTFDDFLAAAETLIEQGWTTAEQLGACGESNGGLLVAAAITQRPTLFAAAVCSAPLTDMARYELSGMGASWRAEYGTAADPVDLRRLMAYSPYHRVRAGARYPATLLTVFDGDTRVDPMHARKMCAALQWATSGPGPVLLRREENVGHGERSLSSGVRLAADLLAFLAAHTGLRIS